MSNVNFIQDFEVGSFSDVFLCKKDASFVMMDDTDGMGDLFITIIK